MRILPNRPLAGGPDVKSLVELLRYRAEEGHSRRAYSFLTDSEDIEVDVTYGQLDERARAIAVGLRGSVRPDARVLLLYPPGLDFIAAFYGCLYAGVITVPTAQSGERLEAIVRDAEPTYVLTCSSSLRALVRRYGEIPGLRDLPWTATDQIDLSLASRWEDPKVDRDSIAFLQYTSGSTGSPRGVVMSHGNLLNNQRMILDGFRLPSGWKGVCWLPLFHDMGLIGDVSIAMYTGAHTTFLSPASFLQRPLRWLRTISRTDAPTMSGGPNFAYEACTRRITAEERETLDLSRWIVAYNGSEVVRADTLERFHKTFAPCGFRRESFYPCYGLAEASLIVTGGDPAHAPTVRVVDEDELTRRRIVAVDPESPRSRALVSSGRPLLGTRVAIVDPETLQPCPSGAIGEVWVSNPSVSRGYWGRPDESDRTFGAQLPAEPGTFLRTGDLGFLDAGELWITGRIKDLIIVRGKNHYPHDLEQTAQEAHAALRAGCGAAFAVELDGEEHAVLVNEIDSAHAVGITPHELLAIARRAISRRHQLHLRELVLIRARTLPKTSSGKIRRLECRKRYLAGDLEIWNGRASTSDDELQPLDR
jgi:acyl-CoA synthetase (AMP-forming)/AMP-acid ligase II